ncbi:MAG: hypothetical protein Q4B82_07610 [Alysiella sp.]|uniref:hypothetical protein n=1 Tax=Alysiella sp. TaxID=1872483 RepID=UPI0026DC4695|nr:hypothetical protein [Alysiella sp.]MDO4434428.1 hypothetical protein [Alysiella sp.]
MQDVYHENSPVWAWAVAYGVLSSLLVWNGIMAFVIRFLILGSYVLAYFVLLRHFTDNQITYVIILLLGVTFPLVLSAMLIPKAA